MELNTVQITKKEKKAIETQQKNEISDSTEDSQKRQSNPQSPKQNQENDFDIMADGQFSPENLT